MSISDSVAIEVLTQPKLTGTVRAQDDPVVEPELKFKIRLNDSAVLTIEHELAEQIDFKKFTRKILELYAEKEDL
ncbi:UNVERIFIED_CONTAM: hypothetical protein NCL1_37064 [Trichonephila clavipes]